MYDDYDDEIGYYDDLLDDIEEQEEEKCTAEPTPCALLMASKNP